MIKEQLIRSMDSVDRERDGDVALSPLRCDGGRNVSFHQEKEEEDDNMDYDYTIPVCCYSPICRCRPISRRFNRGWNRKVNDWMP